jgi:hypothetical protein
MKKKFREIKVNGIVYGWKINDNRYEDGGMWLKIWHDKKVIYDKQVEYNFDGNDSIQVTPAVVRKRIVELLTQNASV